MRTREMWQKRRAWRNAQLREAEDSCTAEGGSWVTIRGTHICIKKGETAGDAFKRTTGAELGKMSPREERTYGDYGKKKNEQPSNNKTEKDINMPSTDNKTGKDMTKQKYSDMIKPDSYTKPVVLINDETGETAVFNLEHETNNAVGYKTKRGVVWLPKSNAPSVNMMYDAKNRQKVKDLGFSTHTASAYRVKNWLWDQHIIGIQKYREIDPSYEKEK